MKRILYLVIAGVFVLSACANPDDASSNNEPPGTGGTPSENQEQDQNQNNSHNENNNEPGDEQNEPVENAIDLYQVFTDYELDHPSYLSEGRSFYVVDDSDYVMAYGHDAHAVTAYEMYEINDNEVVRVRKLISDSEHGEELESISHLEQWEDEMVSYLLEHGETLEQAIFIYDENQEEVEITVEDASYQVYPVTVDEVIYYYKEGEGLWIKQYEDEASAELFGENNMAVRLMETE